jgi:hypothetical protein
MGDLREIQLEPDINPELEFLFNYDSPSAISPIDLTCRYQKLRKL